MKKGDWNWAGLKGHTVIVGSKHESLNHLTRLLTELDTERATVGRDKVFVTESFGDGLPPQLENLGLRFIHGNGSSPALLANAGTASAEVVIVLAGDESDPDTDGRTFDIIHRIRELTQTAVILAECVDDDDRERLRGAGANVVMRPVRAYPEMIVGAIVDPGIVVVLENMFTAAKEHLMALTGEIRGTWAEIVADHVSADRGIPIAYRERATGRVVTAPAAATEVDARALYVVSREGKQRVRDSRGQE